MKAVTHTQYGPPDVLELKELEIPIPKDNEVLIKVYATTVNRTDCAILRANPFIMRFFTGLRKPKKIISGTDFAGKIEAIGKAVTSLKVGDKVFGFDDSGLSSHAQYMTLAEDKAIASMPENITFAQAAASIEGAHYAYNMINKVALKSGQQVLVNGASGAIGAAAVQLLKYYAAHVTAVCNTKNIALVKSIGADQVIDFTKEDFTAKSNNKYHYIFDTVGKSSFTICKPLIKPGGVYISSELGSMVQNPFLALITPFFGNKKVVFPIPSNIKRSVLLIKKLTEEGKFKAVIDRTYPLEEIAEAYRYVETGQKTGNVVILL
ncbi:alcohol dehydrogenase zinc-binding domain-containing protein [Flammeovirgaceae bacterium 311]|nr:alcohol dehydrogenase zinc-binding domain-containing protein [Flammeovirgaceae bacterium 311]